jgi:hypothetical protein
MKLRLLATALLFSTVSHAQNVGIGTTAPSDKLDVRGSTTDDGVVLSVGNADGSHKLGLFGGRLNDPNPFIKWKDGDPLRFATDLSGFNELMRIMPNGNMGIGTTNPLARLHVADSGVLFTGPVSLQSTTSYGPPASGSGSRMMWYPQKAAFRAGLVYNDFWDKDNIGRYSMAGGVGNKAKGEASFASGYATKALGDYSVSLGYFTNTIGLMTTSSGYYTNAVGDCATSMGYYSTARGFNTTTMGYYTIARSDNSVALGMYNDTSNTNRLFEIGNGLADYARSNALTVLANGNTGLGTPEPLARLHVADSAVVFTGPVTTPVSTTFDPPISGQGTRMMWYPQKAAFRAGWVVNNYWDKDSIGRFSFAANYNTKAKGLASTGLGFYTSALGNESTSMGNFTFAYGEASLSTGYNNFAFGGASTVMGSNNFANSNNSLVIGTFNDFSSTDRLFEIGNGTAENSRSNALTVLTNGNVGIGTTTPHSPLSFRNTTGSKISLFSTSATAEYGLGVQAALLQIYSDAASANIAFGYGTSTSFTERAHIINDGYDGMLVNGRLNLRNGTSDPAGGAGIWLWNPLNTATMGFMGVQNSSNIGFYGGPTAWGFTYNTLNGKVGINNNNPDAPLAFSASLEKKITLYPGGTGDVGMSVAGGDYRLYSDYSGGKISFGFDDFTNGFTSRAYVPGSGATAMVVQGNLLVNSTTYTSDARFKKNVEPLFQSLEKILKLKGVAYEMKTAEFPERNFNSSVQIGLIAQEVEHIVPEVVSTATDGYKSVDYAKLVPLLIEGMKEQQKQINELKELVKKPLKN